MVLRTKQVFLLLSIVLLIAMTPLTVFAEQHKTSRASSTGFPYVSGTQIIDASGNPFILRGSTDRNVFYVCRLLETQIK